MPLVSSRQYAEPDEDGLPRTKKIGIYFDPRKELFSIVIKPHMAAYLEREEYEIENDGLDKYKVFDATFDGVLQKYDRVLKASAKAIKHKKREKILYITFEVQAVKETRVNHGVSQEFYKSNLWHHDEKTRMTFDSEIRYRIGNNYFNEDMREKYYYRKDETYIIPWSEERELFFSRMKGSFFELIKAIDEFLKKCTGDPKQLDSAIKGGLKLLPMPEEDS